MKQCLFELFNQLEAIGVEHEELYDTEVRNAMADVIFHGFLKQTKDYSPPTRFGMSTKSANSAIRKALLTFLRNANARAEEFALNTFQSRLAAFQQDDVCTPNEENYHDDFFGWWDPERFDEDGNELA